MKLRGRMKEVNFVLQMIASLLKLEDSKLAVLPCPGTRSA
jgi:hypothetical protein